MTDYPQISSWSNLQIDMHIIGSKSRGESIIILFLDKVNGEVVLSFLIDSFHGIYKYLKEIKARYSFNSLTGIFWTHPHDDHSKDLALIIKNKGIVNNKKNKHRNKYDTHIYLPKCFIENKGELNIEISKDYKKLLENIKETNATKGVNLGEYRTVQNPNWEISTTDENTLKKITVHFLTPDKSKYDYYKTSWLRKGKYNEVSLSFTIEIEDYCSLYLGGDCENNEILSLNKSQKDRIESCLIIKLPHHGSDGSSELLNLVNKKLLCVVTTSDSIANLPSQELLEKYCERISNPLLPNVLNTQDVIKSDSKDIGVIELRITKNADNTLFIDKQTKEQSSK